ncbi:zinc-binding dehydrogenase [Calidifontibacter indicus]|uniref:zinc-binding dehydrogenase n=1 Tax=Calidifontibacter indicus TaxID=419650 RepID=UPI003D7592AF
MAEYLVVKPHNVVPLDKLDPVDAAPLADAALTPMHALNRVRARLMGDSTVVVIGLGGLGHMGVQLLQATTGARIIALDTDPEKVRFAQDHGVHLALPSDGAPAERVLACTGRTVAELREVISLAEDGRISVQVKRYALDDAVQAFDDLHHGKIQGRAVLVP